MTARTSLPCIPPKRRWFRNAWTCPFCQQRWVVELRYETDFDFDHTQTYAFWSWVPELPLPSGE